MKTISISVTKRTDLGKKATKDLRTQEHVPCVMYGGDDVIHFHAHENDFRNLVYSHNVYIVELDIDGNKRKAVMQEIQFNPVTDKIQHIDFVEVSADKPVTINIPIELKGAAEGIKQGGKPRIKRRSLKVKGLVKYLPDRLEIDITNVDVGDVIKIGDLDYPNLEILDPHRSMVYAIVSSRLALRGMEITEPEAEGEEGAEGAEGAEGEAPAEAAAEEEKDE